MTGSGLNGVNPIFTNDCTSSWLELESDPGLFTLLVDDFGVKGIQVEEVYDLTKPLDNSIFGFIFLFKWIERRPNGRRNKSSNLDSNSNYVTDPNIVNNMFFAHQIVPNSCATHALLSVLLNSKTNKQFQLGDLLENFKKLCQGLTPEIKGQAIGNQPRLAQAHNSFAKPDNSFKKQSNATSSFMASSSTSSNTPLAIPASNLSSLNGPNSQITVTISNELFHFICFIPINGRLYELDGLKPYPVDHGPFDSTDFDPYMIEKLAEANNQTELKLILTNLKENYQNKNSNWTNKFKQIILQRLSSFNTQQNHEIRFNLMAVVPDKMVSFKEDLDYLETNKTIIEDFLNETESDSGSPRSDDSNRPRLLRSAKKNDTEKLYDVYFDILSADIVKSLVNTAGQRDYTTKFQQSLIKLLDKFDPIEMLNMFKIKQIGGLLEGFVLKKSLYLSQLKQLDFKLSSEIEATQAKLNEEIDKRKKYMIEALRRKHLYNEFIITYLKALAEHGKLEEIVRNSVTNKMNTSPNENKQATFYISPKTLFNQQMLNKKQRKK